MIPRKKKSRKCTGCGDPVALHPPGTNGLSCQGIPPNLEDQLSGGDGKQTPSDSPKMLEDLGARKAALLEQLKKFNTPSNPSSPPPPAHHSLPLHSHWDSMPQNHSDWDPWA
uniref:Uncharacterized protein n=1 Tax=Branchiostoma floridae TaxID=7739 RepID=C3Y873_BRAFL|eukprot:XP_002607532.1 hypothetical protein BRAFLDRAFT_106480 [Branchiostoma floridae]